MVYIVTLCVNRLGSREDAVQREDMDVDIQVERSPRALDHGHRAAATIRDAAIARARMKPSTARTNTATTPRHTS